MIRMRRHARSGRSLLTMLVASMAALALSACGGDTEAPRSEGPSPVGRPTETSSPSATDPLAGEWLQQGVSCSERRAAVLDAGFTPSDWTLVQQEIGREELCVAHDRIAFGDGRLVATSGGEVAWEGTYEVAGDTILAEDPADTITLRYTLDQDTLSLELVELAPRDPNEKAKTIGSVIWTAGVQAAPYTRQS